MNALDRREALVRMAALLGLASLPATALAAAPRATRPALTAPQFRLLNAVADTILPTTDTPGAIAAGVPHGLDAMLRDWASPTTRQAVLAALERIDQAALAHNGKRFAALTVPQRAAVLLAHDAAALAPGPSALPPSGFGQRSAKSVVDQGYYTLKQLVIDLYYFSPEASATELVYEHVPGQFEPSLKLAPGARPYLGFF